MVAVMRIIQSRMAMWQRRAQDEEAEDIEMAAAAARVKGTGSGMGKGSGTGRFRPPPPAFVTLRPKPYFAPPSGEGKGNKMKAKIIASSVNASPANAFRFVEAVEDATVAAANLVDGDADGERFFSVHLDALREHTGT